MTLSSQHRWRSKVESGHLCLFSFSFLLPVSDAGDVSRRSGGGQHVGTVNGSAHQEPHGASSQRKCHQKKPVDRQKEGSSLLSLLRTSAATSKIKARLTLESISVPRLRAGWRRRRAV